MWEYFTVKTVNNIRTTYIFWNQNSNNLSTHVLVYLRMCVSSYTYMHAHTHTTVEKFDAAPRIFMGWIRHLLIPKMKEFLVSQNTEWNHLSNFQFLVTSITKALMNLRKASTVFYFCFVFSPWKLHQIIGER